MHALVQTIAFRGIDTILVEVQVHIANGLPTIAIVGLADKAVADLNADATISRTTIAEALAYRAMPLLA